MERVGMDAYKQVYGVWRPADKLVWLRRLPEDGILWWCCLDCGWEEFGPKEDLPKKCPNCNRYMIT